MNHPSVKPFHWGAKTAHTWPEFLDHVRTFKDELGGPEILWYRGVSDVDYKLVPSLLRRSEGQNKEQPLFNEYQRSAAHLMEQRSNDWELLFDMQHYGVPTRLLDWTDVLGVAVAFALYNSYDDDKASAIYILDPRKLNEQSGRQDIVRPTNELDYQYKNIYWHNKPLKAVLPVAIDGPLQSNRMISQSGAFTVHGSEIDYFTDRAKDCLKAISIEPAAKAGAREFLEHANLNAFSLYPDMVGMSNHITRKYFGNA